MEPSLSDLRSTIDTIDTHLVKLLSERFDVVREIGLLKKKTAMTPLQPNRRQEVFDHVCALAKEHHLSEEFITKLYELIHEYALLEEK